MEPTRNTTGRTSAEAPVRSIRRSLGMVTLLLLIGTFGYMWIEGWDAWKAFFFTVITLSTVGYGDYGLSETGLRYTTVLIIGGFGVVTYSVSQLAPVLLNPQMIREWKMRREILKLKDHFIVCGLGRVGRSVCMCLARECVPFVAIDPDPELVETAREAGHLAIVGDGASDDDLCEAGIDRAKAVACVTSSDNENIVITLSARQLNPDVYIISRAEHHSTARKVERAGATRVLSPIRAGGESIANAMVKPHLAELLRQTQDVESGIELAEIAIAEGASLDGSTVRDCGIAHDTVVFVALKPSDGPMRFRPQSEDALGAGDVLIVAGDVMAVGRLQSDANGRRAA